jgi:hypothetical protein
MDSKRMFETEQSPKTPFILLNPEGKLEIRGKSIPENSVEFYQPVFSWIENYMGSPAGSTVLDVQLDYFNTSSAKILADIFRKLEQLNETKKTLVTINWHYNDQDDDMLEAGEDYKSITHVPFNLIPFTKD